MVAAIDSSPLLNGIKPIDIAGSIDKGNTALQGEMQTREMQQKAMDQKVVRDLSSVPGVDFSTPKGIKEFMGHLQGRVSPDTILHLGEVSDKLQSTENQRLIQLSKLGDEKRKLYTDTQEAVMSVFDGADKITDPVKRTEEVNKKLDAYAAQTIPGVGQVLSPQAIDSLRGMPWEQQNNIYKGSQHAKELLARTKDEAQLRKLQLQEESLQGLGPKPSFFIDDKQAKYARSQNGKEFQQDADTGEWVSTVMPSSGVRPYGKEASTQVMKQALKEKARKDPWSVPGLMDEAIIEAATGQAPKAGTGATYAEVRSELASTLKNDPSTFSAAASYAADKASMSSISKSGDALAVGEQTVKELLPALQPYLKTQDPTGVKFVNDIILKVQAAMGEVEPIIAQQYVTALQSDIARVQSGLTGAAATPVSFLKKGEVYVPTGLNEANYGIVFEAIQNEMGARTKSNERQKEIIGTRMANNLAKVNERAKQLWGAEAPSAEPAPAPAPAREGLKNVEEARQELKLAREKARGGDPLAIKAVETLQRDIAAAEGAKTPTKNAKGWVLMTDKNGNKAYVGPNKEIEEVK
jgi:hypothetical protein